MAPETEKLAPEIVAALMVREAVPVEDNVIDCDVAELTFTFPKLRLDELMLSIGTAAFNCRAKVRETLPALAVSVASCAVETAETAAEKLALVVPAATLTEAGTVTEAELLARLAANPPLGAAAFSVTLQASVPAPVIDELVQETELSTGTPVPERLMEFELPEDELLATVTAPFAAPAAVGSN